MGLDVRLAVLGVALAALVSASWVALYALARRLPPGLLRDAVAVVADCLTTIGRLRRDPRVPRRAKLAVVLAGIWLISPIDLVPEIFPVIGALDDVIVALVALRYAAHQVPFEVLAAAWPGEPRLLDRLLGRRPPASTPD